MGETQLTVDGKTFYLAQASGEDRLFNTESSAISYLGDVGANVEDTNVTIVKVSFGDSEWEITEVPWKRIALSLLGDDSE